MAGEIVIGYDGTECGHAALDLACDLAKGLGTTLIIAYGYQPYQGAGEIGTQRELMRDEGQACSTRRGRPPTSAASRPRAR